MYTDTRRDTHTHTYTQKRMLFYKMQLLRISQRFFLTFLILFYCLVVDFCIGLTYSTSNMCAWTGIFFSPATNQSTSEKWPRWWHHSPPPPNKQTKTKTNTNTLFMLPFSTIVVASPCLADDRVSAIAINMSLSDVTPSHQSIWLLEPLGLRFAKASLAS